MCKERKESTSIVGARQHLLQLLQLVDIIAASRVDIVDGRSMKWRWKKVVGRIGIFPRLPDS